MDPGGSELDSSIPQPENPCLIVEDSQPDSVALEDDPESSYRAVLARRLSNLQPSGCSPVLELISSPPGSRASQTDSQSENYHSNGQAGPGIVALPNHSSECQEESQEEESQVFIFNPPLNKLKGNLPIDSDSTTPCDPAEDGNSQFGFLALSQSQDLVIDEVNSQKGDECEKSAVVVETHSKLGISIVTSQDLLRKVVRSEVSSSSQSGQTLNVQVLLHSQRLQDTDEVEQRDHEVISSQQDMFDTDKTGATVDSTVSEPEQQGRPTSTPAHTLQLLHLSGQRTLAQQSLSQSSVDYVGPTPDNFPNTPLIIPNSPTVADSQHGADDPMDTCQPPEDPEKEKVQMETKASSKMAPPTSNPVSQSSPGFVLEKPLSLPSQPEFSHDVFVPTLSQETPQPSNNKSQSLSLKSAHQESPAAFSLPLQLSVNIDNTNSAQELSEEILEESQDTQIEELEEQQPRVDTTDKVFPRPDQRSECNGIQTKSQSANSPKPCSPSPFSNVPNLNAKVCVSDNKVASPRNVFCSQSKQEPSDMNPNISPCETPSDVTPCSLGSQSVISHMSVLEPAKGNMNAKESVKSQSRPLSQNFESIHSNTTKVEIRKAAEVEEAASEKEDVAMDQESNVEGGVKSINLVLSQSELMSSGDKEKMISADGEKNVVRVAESNGDLKAPPKTMSQLSKDPSSCSNTGNVSTSTDGHKTMVQEAEGHKDKSLSDSSGEMSFHFTLPKDGELIGPVVGVTPPLINELKRTLRHSTPIETFGEKSEAAASSDVVMVAKDNVPEVRGDDSAEMGDNRLSLRMKLVTPVEEGSSEHFSLQKPAISEEDESVANVTNVAKAETSPSVFSRVRQVHRQKEAEDEDGCLTEGLNIPVRGQLFTSPLRSSQTSSIECNSLLNSQSEPLQQEMEMPQKAPKERQAEPTEEGQAPELSVPQQKDSSEETDSTIAASPSDKRSTPQKTSYATPMQCSPTGKGEPETPPFRRTSGPSHRRHVRTIQEVRTTITRIITDVYYEDGKEVDRKVTEESEDPVVDCHVLDSDISPCRTISSSLTSGDLGDISSMSSKASSLQQSSGGASCTSAGPSRPEFIMPPSRRNKSVRAGGSSSLLRLSAQDQPMSSSEDETYTHIPPPRVPVIPTDNEVPCHSSSLRSSPEEASSAGGSFVGLRVVAKWFSNGYFYSGRIIKDPGEGRFRLRFDDGYECEVAGKDILLCDPIPLETEVTALVEDEFFSVGVIKGYKTEGQDLFYSVERDGQRQWYNRTSVILSLEQGNKLREHHSLGPYEPSTLLAKASDISLDNLVEGKRRRRGASTGLSTLNHSSSSSPGPSKRRLRSMDNESSPAKRSRRVPAAKAAQRVGVCNTSGSGTDLALQPCDLAETHGPMPQNASLFMGFAFMLTVSSESDRLSNKITSDNEEEDYVQTGPFNKVYTESQLQAGGGFVLPDFNEEQCKAAYQSLLIVDQHCRTRKYLLCLASGVPCVSHLWVRDCCKDNKLLNYRNYLLPAGLGPDDAIVEWHPHCSPFKDLHFFLVFETPMELWAQLATLGGASSVRHFHADKESSDVPAGKYDVVVSDHSCPPLIEKNVASLELPLVSPEWLIQSVICGERLGFQSKPEYRHNYYSLTLSSSS
ncbi:TP53-binding protein 1 isoform X2 [Corythoichthys intestinalis]|uniref:TP53-binding protein 1 isoform X2 n=1 Tax=Corythoichthys intestinalis TaxID=161448 RepID=UPI0025A62C2A|nr:TP53-binding protein 1 isoform X2 [Corythoichthys intestinalis]